MTTEKRSQRAESLHRAVTGTALTNYPAIFQGFADKGIAEDQIKPRENVFTFNAWKALGYSVRKGEHGVKVITWVTVAGKDAEQTGSSDGETETMKSRGFRMCRTTTVFHESQVAREQERAA